jgi:hypothetical protein
MSNSGWKDNYLCRMYHLEAVGRMDVCSECGSELIGAKKYCVVCGAPGGTAPVGGGRKKGAKKEKEVVHFCYICEEEADRVCFFCDHDVCRGHTKRAQPNRLHVDQWRLACDTDSFGDINNAWTGRMVYACFRCFSRKLEKELNSDEAQAMGTVDRCNWYAIQ